MVCFVNQHRCVIFFDGLNMNMVKRVVQDGCDANFLIGPNTPSKKTEILYRSLVSSESVQVNL
jgi:hypothetical protein